MTHIPNLDYAFGLGDAIAGVSPRDDKDERYSDGFNEGKRLVLSLTLRHPDEKVAVVEALAACKVERVRAMYLTEAIARLIETMTAHR